MTTTNGIIELIDSRPNTSRKLLNDRLVSIGYNHTDFQTAVCKFQEFNGLVVDGKCGPVTEELLLYRPRCANKDIQRAGTCKWPMLDVDYWHDLKFSSMLTVCGISVAEKLSPVVSRSR